MGISGTQPVTQDGDQSQLLSLPLGKSAVVLGAPGTGKTTALLGYLSHLISEGTLKGSEVLYITPNRQSATAMRDQVTLRLGVTTEGPIVRSVDSVAHELTTESTSKSVTLLTGAEQDKLLKETLEAIDEHNPISWPESLPSDVRETSSFRTELREFIMRMSELGVMPEDLKTLANDKVSLDTKVIWDALAVVAEEYWRSADNTDDRKFDSASLLAVAASHVATAERSELRDRIRLILVDDAQEMTVGFLNLLLAWRKRPGVSVVMAGNANIAAGTFRGVAVKFKDLIPKFNFDTSILLTTSYRLGPILHDAYVNVANHILVTGTETKDRKAEHFAAKTNGVLRRLAAPSEAAQARRIADVLREWHSLGFASWGDMLVVTRTSRQALQLEQALGRHGIPSRKDVSRVILKDEPGARWVLDAAKLAYEPEDPFAHAEVLGGYKERAASTKLGEETARAVGLLTSPLGGLDPLAIRRLRLGLRAEALEATGGAESPQIASDVLLCSAMAHPAEFAAVSDPAADRAAAVATAIHKAREIAKTGTVEDVIWHLWTSAGIQAQLVELAKGRDIEADDANRQLDAIVALQNSARRWVERNPKESGKTFITELLDAKVPDDSLAPARVSSSVLVTTPAQLNGLEFKHVVIAGLQDGVWPNLRPRNSLLHADLLEQALKDEPATPTDALSERNTVRSQEYAMFALAFTRASESVVLSAVENEEEQASPLARALVPEPEPFQSTPSTLRGYVGMLRARLVDAHAAGGTDAEAATLLTELAEAGVSGASPDEWFGLLGPSTTEVAFPAGKELNLSPSGLEKLEDGTFSWFLDRIASTESGSAQGVGVVVHKAFEAATGPGPGTLEVMTAAIRELWPQIHFDSPWAGKAKLHAIEKALPSIIDYLEEAAAANREFVGAECQIKLQLDEDTIVSGRIDRVERDVESDGLYIVDLKTSKEAITGPKALANLQLQVYQLAITENAIEGLTSTRSIGAALLYPLDKGSVRKQPELSSNDIEALKEKLRDLALRIRSDDFQEAAETPGYGSKFRYEMHFIPEVSAE